MRIGKIVLPQTNIDELCSDIEIFIRNEVIETEKDGLLLEVKDVQSLLTLILSDNALSRYGFDVSGYVFTVDEKPQYHNIEKINKIADDKNVKIYQVPLDKIKKDFEFLLPTLINNDIHLSKALCRTKTNILHTIASYENKLVLGSLDRDDITFGNYVLFGHGAVHAQPLGNVPKQTVKEAYGSVVSGYTDNTGLENFVYFGYSDFFAGCVLEGIQQKLETKDIISSLNKMGAVERARYYGLFMYDKFATAWEMVSDVVNRINAAGQKRNLINAKKANISLHYE